jgi:two-component system, NtrC family, response regulator AtoC
MKRILVIDDDPVIRMLAAGILNKAGYDVLLAEDGKSGLKITAKENPDMVITDHQMPGLSGLDLLSVYRKEYPGLPVVMLTAFGDAALTIKAVQHGAFDFIEKPINAKELLDVVKNGLATAEREKEGSGQIPEGVRKSLEENLLVGKSAVMRELFKNIGRVSLSCVNVMITGESGTGKERAARLIHFSGLTRDYPLVTVKCHALTEEQLAFELFGVDNDQEVRAEDLVHGKFMQAREGSIVLDEFPSLSLHLQTLLLNVIDQIVEDASGKKGERSVLPRIISITSRDVEALVKEGKFSSELYYRLKVFSLHMPPLRERQEDLQELVQHLIQNLNPQLRRQVSSIGPGVTEMLKHHPWPGNIRELKNVLAQAMIISPGDVLEKKFITLNEPSPRHSAPKSLKATSLADMEKEHIQRVLEMVNWNKQEAASLLGITRPTLNAKIDKYGLKLE